LNELKKRGYRTALITGSFKAAAEKAQELLGLERIIAHCELIFDESGKIRKWELIPCDYEGKVSYFQKLAAESNLRLAECIYVGDEVNDTPIFRKAGLSIAFNCQKEEVKGAAHITIEKKDLREILQHLAPIKRT